MRAVGHLLALIAIALAAANVNAQFVSGNEAVKVISAEAKFAAAISKKCPAIPFGTLAADAGLDLGALDPICTAVGVGPVTSLATYQECVRRTHACEAASVLRTAAPRAGEMLLQVQRPLFETFCPFP